MKSVFLALGLMATFIVTPAFASMTCHQVVLASGVFPEASEIQNSQKVSRQLGQFFKKQSDQLAKDLKSGVTSNSYDLIIIGAGPQAAAAALSLKDSGVKVLIVDKAPLVASNFASKEFIINSVETNDFSMHDFAYSPLKFNNFVSSKYASSLQLAALLQAHIYFSKASVLLNSEIKFFEVDSASGRVLLKNQTGQVLSAKNVFIATGLGEATTKIPDAGYREMYFKALAHKDALNSLQSIMNTETFMKLLNRAPKSSQKVTLPATVALIGNGDGARITVEEMLEPYVQLPKDFKISWIGNPAKTAEEYIQSQEGWDRYIDKVVPFYKKNQIHAVTGFATQVQQLPSGKFKITTEDKATSTTSSVEVDMIIDSTGYDNAALNLIKTTFVGSQLVDVKGDLVERDFKDTALGKQVQTADGKNLGLYFVGPAAGPLTSKEELARMASRAAVSIHMNIPRTSELALKLFDIKKGPRPNGKKEVKEPVLTAEEILKIIL